VQYWLLLNLFLPSGGRRAPVQGVCVTFVFSGVLHELMFCMATSHMDGYQLAFFTMQAPAVVLSKPLSELATRGGLVGRLLARGLTILWMTATSVLFFHGVDRVAPFFYVGQPGTP
jgi:hypothetical protein